MSTLFTTDFAAAAYADLGFDYVATGFPTPVGPISGYGCNNGFAATCHRVLGLGKEIGSRASLLTTATIRGQFAWYSTKVPATLDGTNASRTILELNCAVTPFTTYCTTEYRSNLKIHSDGSFSYEFTNPAGGPFVSFSSGTGLFPFDGTLHGIQISLSFTGTDTVAYNIVLDNSSIISGSYVAGANWRECTGAHTPILGITETRIQNIDKESLTPFAWMNAWAEFTVEDAVNIISYSPCTSVPISDGTLCGLGPNVTGLFITCTENKLFIIGTRFPFVPTVEVQDPHGQIIGNSILSSSSTEIVVEIDEFTMNGTWCVSVS